MLVDDNEVALEDIILTSAEDTLFFGRVFFPKAFASKSPVFHEDMAHKLDLPGNKIFKVFRGGAKTTITRVFAAKRISFAISRVIVIVGKGQDHAIKSVMWLKNQVQNNKKWAETFKITIAKDEQSGRPKKWTDEWITIHHGIENVDIHIVAFGITGQLRGINIDDFRPDFIVCDDIIDDENAYNEDRRRNLKERFNGALMKSLAKKATNPDACVVMLQTPIDKEDLCEELCKSPLWISAEYSCFTPDGYSQWEEMFPLVELLKEKEEAIRTNTLSTWNREMEVKITSKELRLFKEEWLSMNTFQLPLKEGGFFILSCDPTPEPKEKDQKNVEKLDDAVVMILYFCGGHFYVVDYYTTKSPQTPELAAKVFEFYMRYRPRHVMIETVLFARTVKSTVERMMHQKGVFFVINPVEDKRNKYVRIKDTLQGLGSEGRIHVMAHHIELISQWNDYPQVSKDDILDALSLGTMAVNPSMLAVGDTYEGTYEVEDESEFKTLAFGGAP